VPWESQRWVETNQAARAKRAHRWLRDGWLGSLPARAILRTLLACGGAVAGVAGCTWLAFRLGFNLAASGFLYLVVVVLAAVYGGGWEATVTAVVSFACLNYFFVPPIWSFHVSDPANWVALGTFELTALVISRLSRRAQVQAAEALAAQHDSERLYRTAQRLLQLERSRAPGPLITSLIREVFDLPGVVLFDAVAASIAISGTCLPEAEERCRSAYYLNADAFDTESNTWFCVLRLGVQPVGGLALCDCTLTPLVATALASLSAIALERARSFEAAYRAEAARQSEQLRTAVLDALAHDFKTPLTIIRTASSGFLTAGNLSATQTELLILIDEQAQDLNALASRLLGAAKLDSTDFQPQCEPVLLSSLVNTVIQSLDTPQCRGRFCVNSPDHEPPVLADRQLIVTALAQLVDNAIKYSVPGSPIDIGVTVSDTNVTVTVRNQGVVIAPADRERIFERFYRVPGTAQRSAGTGLGLAIVKRIVDAHRGRVWVESDVDAGTVFAVALPRAPRGHNDNGTRQDSPRR
jgi:two-component system, OmpR family, sensor histidine kinase KdpD